MFGMNLSVNVVAPARLRSGAREKCRGRFGGGIRTESGKWGIVRFRNESRVECLQYTVEKKQARGKL